MKKICSIYFLALFISSCGATNPTIEFNNTLKRQEGKAALSAADAITRVRANEIFKGTAFAFELIQSDPIIKLRHLSYYKVFKFEHDGSRRCQVTINSFNKGMDPWYSILPVVTFVSPSQKINSPPPKSLEGKLPKTEPYHLSGKWQDKCSEKGTYYVLVSADMRVLNKRLDEQTIDLYLDQTNFTYNLSYPFLGHFTGALEIQVE